MIIVRRFAWLFSSFFFLAFASKSNVQIGDSIGKYILARKISDFSVRQLHIDQFPFSAKCLPSTEPSSYEGSLSELIGQTFYQLSVENMNILKCKNVASRRFCLKEYISRGGHGEIWIAFKQGINGYFDRNKFYILKRILIGHYSRRLWERETYFGRLFRSSSFRNFPSTIWIDSFEFENSFWIVFEQEDLSLHSLLYTSSTYLTFSYLQPSLFWKKYRVLSDSFPFLKNSLYQIIVAVAHLHEHGVVHRDLKPGNILFRTHDDQPRVIISDFSSAYHVLEPNVTQLNKTDIEEILESLSLEYAPPEVRLYPYLCQSENQDSNDIIGLSASFLPSYDVWSIGVIFLEMIIGTTHVFSVSEKAHSRITQKVTAQFERRQSIIQREGQLPVLSKNLPILDETSTCRQHLERDSLTHVIEKSVFLTSLTEFGIFETDSSESPPFDRRSDANTAKSKQSFSRHQSNPSSKDYEDKDSYDISQSGAVDREIVLDDECYEDNDNDSTVTTTSTTPTTTSTSTATASSIVDASDMKVLLPSESSWIHLVNSSFAKEYTMETMEESISASSPSSASYVESVEQEERINLIPLDQKRILELKDLEVDSERNPDSDGDSQEQQTYLSHRRHHRHHHHHRRRKHHENNKDGKKSKENTNTNHQYSQNYPYAKYAKMAKAIIDRDVLKLGFQDPWGLDLLSRLLCFQGQDRISLHEATKHAYFHGPYRSKVDGTEFATLQEATQYDSSRSFATSTAATTSISAINSKTTTSSSSITATTATTATTANTHPSKVPSLTTPSGASDDLSSQDELESIALLLDWSWWDLDSQEVHFAPSWNEEDIHTNSYSNADEIVDDNNHNVFSMEGGDEVMMKEDLQTNLPVPFQSFDHFWKSCAMDWCPLSCSLVDSSDSRESLAENEAISYELVLSNEVL